jgi:uncharacterized protein YdeI (YjbR/CyaY-like superfamily)
MNPKVDAFLSKAEKWPKELEKLRMIILDCGLNEELKWGQPCYTFQNSNVAIIGELKDCCVLSFFKGSLLDDANGFLTRPGENTQTVRLIRFTNVHEIVKMEPVLKAYIYEAIEVERAGLKAISKKNPEAIPEELKKKLDKMPALKSAFYALTPGRQRAYILYFSQPKQSKTRLARVEKHIKEILDGKGLNDDYIQRRK